MKTRSYRKSSKKTISYNEPVRRPLINRIKNINKRKNLKKIYSLINDLKIKIQPKQLKRKTYNSERVVRRHIVQKKQPKKSQAKILILLERIAKINKNGKSEYIQVSESFLRKKGCSKIEVSMFQSNNGVPYLRRDSPICRKYNVERVYDKSKGSLHGFRLIGFNNNVYFGRSISKEIRHQILTKYNKKCVWCGSTDRLEVDHKNGRYNSLMNKVDDFQLLCKSCNDKKRERCKKCKETNARFDAKDISKHLYKCSFLQGSCNYNDKQGCKGCFLYDIEEFNKIHDKKCSTPATTSYNAFQKRKTHEIELIVKEVKPRSKNAPKGIVGRVVTKIVL